MDIWGDIEHNSEQDDEDIGDVSEDQVFETTYEQEVSAAASKDYADSCGPMPISAPGTKEFQKEMSQRTPMESFKAYVNRIALTLNEDTDMVLNVNDRNDMCRLADYTLSVGTDAKYLNALAYVIGYYVYMQGSIIKKDKLEGGKLIEKGDDSSQIKKKLKLLYKIIGRPEHSFDLLQRMNDITETLRNGNSFAVMPADVIRYGQFWERLIDYKNF